MTILRVIANGAATSLSDGDPFSWIGDDGLGAAPTRRIVEQGPLQHGASDVDFRLEPRQAQLVLGIGAATRGGMWAARRALIGLFGPEHDRTLEFVLETGETLRLDVQYVGNMTLANRAGVLLFQRVGVSLQAADPTFYDPVAEVFDFVLSAGTTGFPVPSPVPSPIGSSTIDETRNIAYTGGWRAAPVIRARGPLTDLLLVNESTGERLDFAGASWAEGEWRDIDTRYGYKTVVDQAGVNKIAELSGENDLATFHIAAASLAVPGGVNTLRVTASGANLASSVVVTYLRRELGI